MEQAAGDYGSFELDEVVVVHLLLYGLDRKAPSVADAKAWSDHFGYTDDPQHVVLAAAPAMLGSASYAMIPGLQLLDRDLTLRMDGAGRGAPHDLWTELLPNVPTLLAEEGTPLAR